ncbi:MAG: FdtA/QdtA family cupin domain-containing protein [Muribaculaceae bacterium]|nr:FdtA/QdtA family cupin domain-containing protein [Muribaculaceae bacterium]
MENKRYTIDDCCLITLERFPSDRLGNLSVIESGRELPFDVRRMFFIYDVPGGESRGGHSHRAIREFIVAASGSFFITLDDGKRQRTVLLNRPDKGLLIEPDVWISLHDFSSGAIALVFTSDFYDPADHIKDYDEFLGSR